VRGWDNGLGWHQRDDLEYLVVREPRLFRQHSDVSWNFRSTWVKTPQGWCQLEQDCAWVEVPRMSARVPGWVEKGIFLFSKARGVAPVSHSHVEQEVSQLVTEPCCANPIGPQGALWILRGGLWCRANHSSSEHVSESGVYATSSGPVQDFGAPSPLSCCRHSSGATASMTTLSATDDVLSMSNPKSWLRQHIQRCKMQVDQHTLVVPGVSPETMGGGRTDAVVKLSFHCRGYKDGHFSSSVYQSSYPALQIPRNSPSITHRGGSSRFPLLKIKMKILLKIML